MNCLQLRAVPYFLVMWSIHFTNHSHSLETYDDIFLLEDLVEKARDLRQKILVKKHNGCTMQIMCIFYLFIML